jgi:hypothetical protein
MRTYQQDHNKAKYGNAYRLAREAFARGLMLSPVWLADTLAAIPPGVAADLGKQIGDNSGFIGTDSRETLGAWLEAMAASEALDEFPDPETM